MGVLYSSDLRKFDCVVEVLGGVTVVGRDIGASCRIQVTGYNTGELGSYLLRLSITGPVLAG